MKKHGTFEYRFWTGVYSTDKEACWNWMRYVCGATGYGRLAGPDGYQKIGAHRASWLINRGPIPDGLWVLHKCDNRRCVNPDHLFLGTCEDNVHDMWEKGRGSKPPLSPPGKSLEQVRQDNKIRMGRSKTHCKRGHRLPPYEPGRTRKCYEPTCREARRFNALGR